MKSSWIWFCLFTSITGITAFGDDREARLRDGFVQPSKPLLNHDGLVAEFVRMVRGELMITTSQDARFEFMLADGSVQTIAVKPPPPNLAQMKTPARHWFQAAIFFLGMAATSIGMRGEVAFAPIFSDHAVLQCDRPVAVWGTASPGEQVVVSLRNQRLETVADAAGRWRVRLAPEHASATAVDLVASGANTVTVRDILMGEVWLASGQSNMARPLSDTLNAEQEIASAKFPLIRQFSVGRTTAEQPAQSVGGTWQICTPDVVGRFSGVGYFFARHLHRRLGVPIGLIDSSWGGTPIESWISEADLQGTTVYPAILARWKKDCAEFEERQRLHPAEALAWKAAEDLAQATHAPNPVTWPTVPVGPGTPYAPSRLYNGRIAPLQSVAVRGIIWWQGEANVTRPGEYGELFRTLIHSWRQGWQQSELPFYFVQLTNYQLGWDRSRVMWARLREAQASALALPETGMVVTIDVGDPFEMHLANKQEAGRRLALVAAARTYGQGGVSSGPIFRSATPEGEAMRVRFTDTGSALKLHGALDAAFELAGADKVFHAATVTIERDSLRVVSPAVKRPVAVRYAWINAPVSVLSNQDGLPAAPFRSDDW